MSNHHPRSLSLSDPVVLDKVAYEKVIRLHKERFGNANDFTFIIDGNLKESSVRQLVENWLGGLPSVNKKEAVVDHNQFPAKGIVKKHFSRKMEIPQSTITIAYTGKVASTIENHVLISFTAEILNSVFKEEIREKEGGSYGVGVRGEIGRYPKELYTFQVNFDTDPDPVKKEKLIGIVYKEIKKMMEQGPSQEKVDKVRANFLKGYLEGREKENSYYWIGISSAELVHGIDWRTNYDQLLSSITAKKIQEFAKNIFSQGNIMEIVLNPLIEQKASSDITEKGCSKSLDGSESRLERFLHFENKHRNLRDSGFKAWFEKPSDPKQV